MTAELLGWRDEHLLDHRRRLRTGMFVSAAVHGLIVAVFAITPPRPVAVAPEYLAVDLVAAPPAPAPAAASAPAPAPAAPPPPAEAAPAEPPPPVAPAPIAEAPVQVLPEETPGNIRKAKPDPPKVVAKVQPKPKPEPIVRRPKRDEALSYEAAMAELGLDETSEALVPAPSSDVKDAPSDSADSASKASSGVKVSPEELAWGREVTGLIRRRFPNFARYEGRGLLAQVEVQVSASGALASKPRLVGTSGDLDFDRMIIAVVERAAPLPPPPRPGALTLRLKSDQ